MSRSGVSDPTALLRLIADLIVALVRMRLRIFSLRNVTLSVYGRERIRQVALWYLLVYRRYRMTESARTMSSDVDRFAMGIVTWCRRPEVSPLRFVERFV